MPGLAVGRPLRARSSVGTAPDRARGRTAVHRVAQVVLRNRWMLSLAEKRDGADQYVVRAGPSELGEACAARS